MKTTLIDSKNLIYQCHSENIIHSAYDNGIELTFGGIVPNINGFKIPAGKFILEEKTDRLMLGCAPAGELTTN